MLVVVSSVSTPEQRPSSRITMSGRISLPITWAAPQRRGIAAKSPVLYMLSKEIIGCGRIHRCETLVTRAEFNDPDTSRSDLGIAGGQQPQPSKPVQPLLAAPEGLLQNSLSFQGLPGIIDIPTAIGATWKF